MPQLMPLNWVLSVIMVILFFFSFMLFFGNFFKEELIKWKGSKMDFSKKWLW